MGALPRVLVVHPKESRRRYMHRQLVESGFRVVGEAASAASGLVLVENVPGDVLLIGPCLGDVARTVRHAKEAGLEVVLVVEAVNPALAVDMMLAGVTGLVCECDLGALPEAVRGVLGGGAPVPLAQIRPLMVECCSRLARHDCSSPWMRLSERQREVMELVARGTGTHTIAEKLFVEPVTVRAHIAAAVHRLGAGSREEALAVLEGRKPDAGVDATRDAG